jgi:hypothetical protein
MKSKVDIRKQLEEGLAVFLGQGKQITKCEPKKKQNKPKEEIVEIEVDFLPKALQQKYFKEV